MIDFILSFFGATFIYAGMLMAYQDAAFAMGSAILGLILIARPLIRFIRFAGKTFGKGAVAQGRRKNERQVPKSGWRREDDTKPTYH